MNMDELDDLLRQWGALSKYTQEKKEGSNDFHALARSLDFAPGTRARAAMRLVGRDGFDRRTLMATAANAGLAHGMTCGIRIVPASFVDPIPCTESRRAGGVSDRARDDTPEHLRPVALAARELYRIDTLRGLCLRLEYCGYGPQTEKAERVALAIGSPVGLRVYREALAHAKGWMHGRLAA